MKRSIIGASLALALVLLAGPAAGSAAAACSAPGKVTAYDDPIDQNSTTIIFGASWFAQPFTVPASTILTTVSLYLEQYGTPSHPIDVDVRSTTVDGKPGALLGTRRRTVTNTSFEFADFDFSSDQIALNPGQTYYLLLRADSGSLSNGTVVGSDYNHPHQDYPGTTYYSGDSGSSWQPSSHGEDALFRVFGQTCTADVPPPGGGGGGGGGSQPQGQASVSTLAFSNTAFAAEGSGPSAVNARRKAPRGTKVSFKLNEAAKVRFTVTQRVEGRKVRRGTKTVCVKPTRSNRKKKSCTRVVTLTGSFTRNGIAGKNSFHFTGRLNGRKLKPGSYRLVATPSVGAKTGRPTSTGFQIIQ